MEPRAVRIAHTAESDDAFMFYALAEGKIDTGDVRYVHELQDIESLNQRAALGELDVAAVSIHAYAYLADRYVLLPHGATLADRGGPRLVAREPLTREALRGKPIATPGPLTSAYLALNLYEPDFTAVQMPFDTIEEAVLAGEAAAGVLIHEGQLTHAERGLHLVVDLGAWWTADTGLPLPLGGIVVRRDLGPELIRSISRHLRDSIDYALHHREDALDYALRHARESDRSRAAEFVAMYVNEWTLDYGERGREAVRLFLQRGVAAGMITRPVELEFAESLRPRGRRISTRQALQGRVLTRPSLAGSGEPAPSRDAAGNAVAVVHAASERGPGE